MRFGPRLKPPRLSHVATRKYRKVKRKAHPRTYARKAVRRAR